MTPEEAVDHYIPQMEGWSTPEKCKKLMNLVIETRSNSLEIGIFGGRSLVSMGFGHRVTGNGVAIGLDPWKHEACVEGSNDKENDEWWKSLDLHAIYASFVSHVLSHNLLNYVEWMRIGSKEALPILSKFYGRKFGVIHQDGNHSAEVSAWEIENYLPLLNDGGYWVMDDTDWPTTEAAQKLALKLGLKEIEDHGAWKVYQK